MTRLIFTLLIFVLLPGCAELAKTWRVDNPPPIDLWNQVGPMPEMEPSLEPGKPKALEAASTPDHVFPLNEKDGVVGRLATVQLREGDTLLDIARHYGVGYQHIVEANPGVDIWVPQTDVRVVLPLQFTLPNAKRSGVVINIATMRLFYFKTGKTTTLTTWPIGIGREGRSTPLGLMAVSRKMQHPTWYVPESIRRTHAEQGDPLPAVVPPGPDNPLGDFALYLSKPSYLIHGTNKPFSIGLRASNGCIRLYPEDIAQAFKEIPPNTPVNIVNQPYVYGWLNGVLYLEAHEPFDEVDVDIAIKNLKAELERVVKDSPKKIDWAKVEDTLRKRRGIPIPIMENTPSLREMIATAPHLERPAQLTGQPDKAEPGKKGWFIQTEASEDAYRANKLAAQMNHFGPRIPAYTKVTNGRYQVVGGPFTQEQAAKRAQLALEEDFNTKSEIIKPDKDYVPPKPVLATPTPAVKKADTVEATKPAKPDKATPVKADPAKTEKAEPLKATKPEPAKTEKAEPAKATKPEPPKTEKPAPSQPVDWIEQQKAKNPPAAKPAEKKVPVMTLKLPKPLY